MKHIKEQIQRIGTFLQMKKLFILRLMEYVKRFMQIKFIKNL
jgi:hypothetical protein